MNVAPAGLAYDDEGEERPGPSRISLGFAALTQGFKNAALRAKKVDIRHNRILDIFILPMRTLSIGSYSQYSDQGSIY